MSSTAAAGQPTASRRGPGYQKSRTFIEADLATPANLFSFWAEAYEDNLEHYGLEVSMVSPNRVARPAPSGVSGPSFSRLKKEGRLRGPP